MRGFLLILVLTVCILPSEAASFLAKWLLRSHIGSTKSSSSSSLGLHQCPEIPSDMTFCSSVQRRESVQEANIWISLLNSHCHPQLMKFICSIYNPVCLQSHQVMPIQPCRELCEQVHSQCISRMYLFGFTWPEHVKCDLFPSDEDSMCISSKRETVTCSPCEQPSSRANVVKKFCEADVVVKSQISRVTVFGNTSSLLVTLDKITERLHPQPEASQTRYVVEEIAPSPGFLDTSYLDEGSNGLIGPTAQRTGSGRVRPVNPIRLDTKTRAGPPEQPQPNGVRLPAVAITTSVPLTQQSMNRIQERQIRRHEKLPNRSQEKRQRLRRRRERRSPSEYGSPLSRLLLECAGCPLDLPVVPLASNSAHRWLVMAKRINDDISQRRYFKPVFKITALIPWSKDSVVLKEALRDIRTIPREMLCDPNAQVQMHFDGNVQPTTAPSINTHPLSPYSQYSEHRSNWEPTRILNQPLRNNGGYQRPPKQGWPYPFDRLLQNDAGLVSPKNGGANARKLERRRQRKQIDALNVQQSVVNATLTSEQTHQLQQPHQLQQTPLAQKERRRKRRQQVKQRLAHMSPEERKRWKQAKRARRERRRQVKRQQRKNQAPGNLQTLPIVRSFPNDRQLTASQNEAVNRRQRQFSNQNQ